MEDLKFDDRNFNKHTDKGMEMLEKSIKEYKFGRSILVDKNGNIIAGNGIAETALKLGKKDIHVIETTGDELVVVKRIDVDINTKEGREMALADNATSAADLAWDDAEIRKAEEEWGVAADDWGVDIDNDNFNLDEFFNEEEKKVEETKKKIIVCPHCGKEIEI